ncbi:MAG: hypothetical protein IJQ79_02705 [Bacteroidales bacterium]|nr:hypothetical protein [Bacteroidales bacterium]
MTKEQCEKLQPWLEKNGLKLTHRQLGELEMEIQRVQDKNSVLLHMDTDSFYFDASRREQIVKVILACIIWERSNNSEMLDEVIRSAAGYAMAGDEDVMASLKKFANYTIDAAQQLGNFDGLKKGLGHSIVVPFKGNEKVKN